jgi:hypothetical protein
MPGWRSSSWGYHGDDGNSYAESGSGTPYGETFGSGDVIGCLMVLEDGVVFTKNGISFGKDLKNITRAKLTYVSAGIAFHSIPGRQKLYPVVGMRSRGARIRVNFGQEQFRYDYHQDTIKEIGSFTG